MRNLAPSQELEEELALDQLLHDERRPLKERAGLLLMDWEDIDRALLGRTGREIMLGEMRKKYPEHAHMFYDPPTDLERNPNVSAGLAFDRKTKTWKDTGKLSDEACRRVFRF